MASKILPKVGVKTNLTTVHMALANLMEKIPLKPLEHSVVSELSFKLNPLCNRARRRFTVMQREHLGIFSTRLRIYQAAQDFKENRTIFCTIFYHEMAQ